MLDNSNASVIESLCSNASMDESLCSNGDVALQRDIKRIIHEHTDNIIKKWENSEQWILELQDGKRVAVPIHISLPPGDVAVGVDSNQLAMVPRVSSESKEINSELEKGVDVIVEDWAFDFCSKDAFQFTNSSPPLNVEPQLSLCLRTSRITLKGQQLETWRNCWVRTITQNGFRKNSVVLMIFLGHPSKVWKSQQPNSYWLLNLSYSRGLLRKN